MNTRAKLIEAIIRASSKRFDEGTSQVLSSANVTSRVLKTIPTGSPLLDRILAKDISGNYGMPVGRIIGISGAEASGKTTLLMMLMKNVQKMGGVAALIETEHAFDPAYAKQLGINLDELIISQPDYLERALDLITMHIEMFKTAKKEYMSSEKKEWGVPMLIGFDSIAGTPPKAEIDADSYEDNQAQALHARILSKFFRKASGLIARDQVCFICTNQTKTDTNVRYGSKDTEIGGRALKFHATLRLDIKRSGFIKAKGSDEPIGIETIIKTVKNKTMVPFKQVTLPIIFGEGISYHRALYEALLNKGIIKKSGRTYEIEYKRNDKELVMRQVGEENFIEKFKALCELPSVMLKLEKRLNKSYD